MKVLTLRAVVRELEREPKELKESIYGALGRLERGERIPMPLCRPLSSVIKGLYELRFSYRAGEYRVFYYIKIRDAIYVIHAAQKKNQKMEDRLIELLKSRIRGII